MRPNHPKQKLITSNKQTIIFLNESCLDKYCFCQQKKQLTHRPPQFSLPPRNDLNLAKPPYGGHLTTVVLDVLWVFVVNYKQA